MDDPERRARLTENTVRKIGLSLDNETVYTEAATGPYSVTAPIAALAGADTVYALAQDSMYGSHEEAIDETESVATALGVDATIEYVTEKHSEDIAQATVLTNNGHVRPIDHSLLSWTSTPVAVPLMYEPWEYRERDVDVEACWERGIPVLGTDESNEMVRTYEYIGHGVQKVAYECGLEVLGCRFVIIGGGPVATKTAEILDGAGAIVSIVDPVDNDEHSAEYRDFRSLDEVIEAEALIDADALIVAEHREDYPILGGLSPLDPETLATRNPSLSVIHVCGRVDATALDDSELYVAPRSPRPFGYMTFGAEYVGSLPVIALQTAGLRVGAELVAELRDGYDYTSATERVARRPYALDFSEEFKRRNGYRNPDPNGLR